MRFLELVESISGRSPLQRKKISTHLAGRSPKFFSEADAFTVQYSEFLASRGLTIEYAIDAYLKMCTGMLRCQLDFMRTGRYPVQSSEQANLTVYSSEDEMLSYMIGLGISQFLWATHYEMFSFFTEAIRERADSISSYLEIGPGHDSAESGAPSWNPEHRDEGGVPILPADATALVPSARSALRI